MPLDPPIFGSRRKFIDGHLGVVGSFVELKARL
jgi:hypothetical protein